MDYTSIDVRDRRLVIIASERRAAELSSEIDWKINYLKDLPLASSPAVLAATGVVFEDPIIYLIRILLAWLKKRRHIPYPVLELKTARDQFTFPINHPTDGGVYASCDSEPKLYVPLSAFHRYMYEAKMSAFHLLCANLGVKSCRVVYAEEEGKEVTGKFGVSGIPTQGGPVSGKVEAGRSKRETESASLLIQLPRPVSPPVTTVSGWMNGEPTWAMMQTLRLERNLEHYTAEFDYTSDMGVNGSVAAKVMGIGLDIGGRFEEIKTRKWRFDVEFWPNLYV